MVLSLAFGGDASHPIEMSRVDHIPVQRHASGVPVVIVQVLHHVASLLQLLPPLIHEGRDRDCHRNVTGEGLLLTMSSL